MRTDFWLCALVGMANATALINRQDDGYGVDPYEADDSKEDDKKGYKADPPAYKEDKKEYKPDPPKKEYKPDPPAYKEDSGYKSDHNDDEDYPSKQYKDSKDYSDDDNDKYAYAAKKKGYSTEPYEQGDKAPWRPKTSHPEFFSLRVDEKCDEGEIPATTCQFDNYAVRLEQGIVIATPYNKWWDPKLPILFVDDDTQLYTVSKKPLQLYVDAVTGALRYAPVGWLPPNSIAFSFYKTGSNPLGNVDPSPAHLSWPSTQGNTLFGDGPWSLCALGNTGQYQVFVSNENYQSDLASGVYKDPGECFKRSLAAINASPWRSGVSAPY